MTDSQQIQVDLRIAAEEWLRLYRGEAYQVSARSRDGRQVRFPARILQPFVSHDGVSGSFVITFDGSGKFMNIKKI